MYTVIRDCCTSGNCINCQHLPFGNRSRVLHIRTDNKKMAEEMTLNFRYYNAKMNTEEEE